MHVTVTSFPDPLVSLDEAKVALGESGSDRNNLIKGMVFAAQAELDGPKGWVGISVAEQKVTAYFDCFGDALALPAGPVVEVTEVKYLDSNGEMQTLDDAVYTKLSDGRLVLSPNQSWPATYPRAEAVSVSYSVGIDDTDDPRVGLMKTAIVLHVRMTLDMQDQDKIRNSIEALVRPMWVPAI